MLVGAGAVLVPRWVRARLGIAQALHPSLPEGNQLRELSAVVLPASLARAGTDAVADRFARWLEGYRPGADLGYGYGLTRPEMAPASPAWHYLEQLQELEAAAQGRGSSFGALPSSAQGDLVAAALAKANIQTVPRRPSGGHVAADLMSFFFYVDPQGEDFLYGVSIKRAECRGLASSGDHPALT